jgi:hypothetical protein
MSRPAKAAPLVELDLHVATFAPEDESNPVTLDMVGQGAGPVGQAELRGVQSGMKVVGPDRLKGREEALSFFIPGA